MPIFMRSCATEYYSSIFCLEKQVLSSALSYFSAKVSLSSVYFCARRICYTHNSFSHHLSCLQLWIPDSIVVFYSLASSQLIASLICFFLFCSYGCVIGFISAILLFSQFIAFCFIPFSLASFDHSAICFFSFSLVIPYVPGLFFRHCRQREQQQSIMDATVK